MEQAYSETIHSLPDKKKDLSEISKFILSFIQALLRTGYYTPDHPETEKAKAGLYNDFRSILKGHKELSFMAVEIHERRDVLVDGIVDEPMTLSSLMLKGMAEMFAPKFLDYFDRKNLASFSIKADITKDDFEAFIDILSEPPFHEEKEIDIRERFTLELIKKGILKVSTIFNIDLVGKERRLPWRVEISLTRLKRDLNLIPLYKNLSEEKIAEIKHMVFDDIIRPVKSPELIRDILLNLDLISHDIAGISKEEFEDSVTDFIHKDYLFLAAPEVLKSFILVKESYERLRDEGILPRRAFLKDIAKKVGLKIIHHGSFKEAVIIDYFNHGILTIEELPEGIKIKVKRKEEIEQFLKEPHGYFINLERAKDQEEFEKGVLVLLNFLPELLGRALYTEAREILKNVKEAGFNFFKIDSLLLDEIISAIEKRLEEGAKEEQIRIMEMIDLMGEISTVVFIGLLTHEIRVVRRIACEMLIKHGISVVPILRGAIEKREDWQFLKNALMVLGEVGHGVEGLGEIFKKFLNHEEPRVREEAVRGIINIIGVDAEGLLLNALKDIDPSVRRRAIWALGKINSIKPEAIAYFTDTIKGRQEEDEATVEQVLSSIGTYQIGIEETEQLEQAILEVLSRGRGILGRFTVKFVLSDNLKAKACETLGYIGGQRSIEILKKMTKSEDHLIRTKAIEAIKIIEQRLLQGSQ